jgi:hypothetical protein
MICQPSNQTIVFLVAQLALLLLEAWLGKTDKVQAGSTLELLANVMKALAKIVISKGE